MVNPPTYQAPPTWFDLACIEILVNRAINSSGVNVKSPAGSLIIEKINHKTAVDHSP